MRARRPLAAAVALAAALPALAYVLPAPAVLRLAARKRVEGQATSAELRGTFASGETPPTGAVLWVKGGRCRLELVGLPERPFAVVRAGRVAAQRGLDAVPGALALAEGACALLAPSTPDGYAQAFAARGIALQEVALGKLGPSVGYVLGGRGPSPRPQAWIDKQALHPFRLVAELQGALRDVRLLEWPPPPSPAPGERVAPPAPPDALWPRAVEVHLDDALEARLSVDQVTPNPRIAASLL